MIICLPSYITRTGLTSFAWGVRGTNGTVRSLQVVSLKRVISFAKFLSQAVSGFHHQFVLIHPPLHAQALESTWYIPNSAQRYASQQSVDQLIGTRS
ncbi:MAG: hypothetical protein ACK578_07380 [Pirellula sp.]